MTPKELREKSSKERDSLKGELSQELFHLKLKKSTGQLEKNHRIKEIRRDVARLLTLEKEEARK